MSFLKSHPRLQAWFPILCILILLAAGLLGLHIFHRANRSSLADLLLPGASPGLVEEMSVSLTTIGVEAEVDDPACIQELWDLFSQMEAEPRLLKQDSYPLKLENSFSFRFRLEGGHSSFQILDGKHLLLDRLPEGSADRRYYRLCAGPAAREIYDLLIAYGYFQIL